MYFTRAINTTFNVTEIAIYLVKNKLLGLFYRMMRLVNRNFTKSSRIFQRGIFLVSQLNISLYGIKMFWNDRQNYYKSNRFSRFVLFAWRTTHETTTKMEEHRIAANREELTEMLAKALDERGIPRHPDQSDEVSMEIGETSVMTTCMST